jgi:hypothetical protein
VVGAGPDVQGRDDLPLVALDDLRDGAGLWRFGREQLAARLKLFGWS